MLARPGQARPTGQTVRQPRVNLCAGRRCTVDGPTRIRRSCGDASRGSVQDSSSCMLDTNHGRYRAIGLSVFRPYGTYLHAKRFANHGNGIPSMEVKKAL